MKQIKNEKEIAGKTLSEAPISVYEILILKFTDGTYCAYYSNSSSSILDGYSLIDDDLDIAHRYRAGIASEKEYKEYIDKFELEKRERIENAKLDQLKKLLEKYPEDAKRILNGS